MLLTLIWLSLASLAVALDQVHLDGDVSRHGRKLKTIMLDFDELPTNSKTGIGFTPHRGSKKHATPYRSVYLESFSLLNTSRAKIDKDDISCATSPPNALFASRTPGHDWPRISMHDLSAGHRHANLSGNATFGLLSFTMSPTGNVPADSFAAIYCTLLRLPTDGHAVDARNGYPAIFRGAELLSLGPLVVLTALYSPGRHDSALLPVRQWFGPDFAVGMNVLEIHGELLTLNKDKQVYERNGDWTACVDDVKLEVDEGGSEENVLGAGEGERPGAVKKVLFSTNGRVRILEDWGSDMPSVDMARDWI